MIELRAVSKTLGGSAVIRDVSFEAVRGETAVLIGPSGCGKSTLLRLMLGLLRPGAGRVWFDGVEVGPATVREVRRRAGYVIQDGGLFPHMTARGNVTLVARQLGRDARSVEGRVEELVALTGFPRDGLERYPVELSGGQRQRVALMRALMLDPDVLLLDEPLGALDPMIRHDLQTELREIFRRLRKTVVLVTHDLHEAAFFGDRIVLLRAGRVVQDGPLRELLERPADPFVTRFVGAQRGHLDGGAS